MDTSSAPISATLTAAGQKQFPYVNASNPLPISWAWTYLATPADSSVTPLLVDNAGHALISTRANADGRETMALTFDSNQWLIHDLVLAHGLVEWVTKGIYLGEFRAYSQPQIDDILIDGGNSYFHDDIRRAARLKEKGIHYLDVGTSGGVWGRERGYCLMIGGDKRAVEVLGMGNRSLRRIPVDDDYAMDTGVLRATIARDVANGIKPICLIGTAGTLGEWSYGRRPGARPAAGTLAWRGPKHCAEPR